MQYVFNSKSHSFCRATPTQPVLAVKILTVWATNENQSGRLHEVLNLQTSNKIVDSSPPGMPLPRLFDSFLVSGPHGNHLCCVVDACSVTLSTFRRSTPTNTLRLHVAQLVIVRVLYALEQLHAAGLVHTGERLEQPLDY